MENNIYREMYQESKSSFKLNNLGLKALLYLISFVIVLVPGLLLLLVPVVGWAIYPMLVFGTWSLFKDAKGLRKMQQYRFKRVHVVKTNETFDDFYALVEGGKIINVMHIIEINKNVNLRRLLIAQMNKKNELLSTKMTEEEFYEYHTGGIFINGI